MPRKVNYLIGKAELLTNLTPPPKIKPPSGDLYTLKEVVNRLKPQFESIARDASQFDESLCPKGYVVTKLTLHPSYIAKGHFPNKLLRSMGVRSIKLLRLNLINGQSRENLNYHLQLVFLLQGKKNK